MRRRNVLSLIFINARARANPSDVARKSGGVVGRRWFVGCWVRRAFKEIRNWHPQEIRELLKTTGADAVLAVFIFLNLLECQANLASKFFLAKPSISRLMRS